MTIRKPASGDPSWETQMIFEYLKFASEQILFHLMFSKKLFKHWKLKCTRLGCRSFPMIAPEFQWETTKSRFSRPILSSSLGRLSGMVSLWFQGPPWWVFQQNSCDPHGSCGPDPKIFSPAPGSSSSSLQTCTCEENCAAEKGLGHMFIMKNRRFSFSSSSSSAAASSSSSSPSPRHHHHHILHLLHLHHHLLHLHHQLSPKPAFKKSPASTKGEPKMAPVHQRAKGSDTSPGQKRRLWGDLPMYAVGQTWIP